MQKIPPADHRSLPTRTHTADVVVVGGGVAGVCFAIAAARDGAEVILVQDRPVLGGNASSEVRLWINGATSHGYNNNRWARESGIMNEIMMANLYRNPGGNAHILDLVFLDMVLAEPKVTLLLNTSVHAVDKSGPDTISGVLGFNSQNETFYDLRAPYFCDASGDGVVGFLAGAAFRIGAEDKAEFGEPFAPDKAFGELLGHSIYFYSKDAGRPVPFVPPSYALPDIEGAIPRYRDFKVGEDGCRLWWIEFGGRLDTVFDTEKIKWELWRIVYGVWNYFKNSGKFPEAANLTLEWVGTIPGKRESRRFEGDYMLSQRDVIEQRRHDDDVAYGGWALDLHPADGVYSELVGCTHYHAKGPYPVPYRTMYSRNIRNLFLAGRVLSCSHVSFGSLRNMASLGYSAQAAGTAAALCAKKKAAPADLSHGGGLKELQAALLRNGQHIRGHHHADSGDLALRADVTASSTLALRELPADGEWVSLTEGAAQLLPLTVGPVPEITFRVRAKKAATVKARLMASSITDNFTPDQILGEMECVVGSGGEHDLSLPFPVSLERAQYVFFALLANEDVEVRGTTRRVTGITSAFYRWTQAEGDMAGNTARARDLGMDEFEAWCPRRRPEGENLAFRLGRAIAPFAAGQVANGIYRPTSQANAWVADFGDQSPQVTLRWNSPQRIGKIVVDFDPDWDHPMESVMKWHSERVMPFTVRDFQVEAADGTVLASVRENYLARRELVLEKPVTTDRITVRVLGVNGACPAALFGVSVYA